MGRAVLNPVQMYLRGFKIAVSNAETAVVAWLALTALVILILVPTVLTVTAGVLLSLQGEGLKEADPELAALLLLAPILEHWPWTMGVVLLLALWVTALFLGFFYVQGGILGICIRAHRAAPSDDFALRPRLGFSPAMRSFEWRGLFDEMRAHGWRVTLVATLYSVAGTALLLLLGLSGYLCASRLLADRWSWQGPAAAFLASLAVFALLSTLLGLHYRYGLACSILGSTTAWEGFRRANRVIGRAPLQVLALFGLAMGANMAMALLSVLVSIPLLVLSFIPVLGILFMLLRTLVTLAQGFAAQVLWVASATSILSLCAGVIEEENPDPSEPPAVHRA